ncbi:hypothetical protein M527_01575 [Sphingobium indicum IP26]|uniref:Uncharacterized protein n=1 Tax=Sphingobium indicum F2 TaxID=1450518 RepID=A0A8E0WNG9_9SPHN|nr:MULTISPECIES: hypothetical protein [Sphingobium]EPR12449.1 hypothetical protein M527_01575 [Sphingobium indicum IP26]EQB08474.1 hypothetical protein L286_02065 [Sphingobium sp. HDIP04]KER34426.1 hypothetical protein AL00_21495 [Sphingobium indicum F2]
MSELLDLAIAAHGGWDRWEQINELKAHFHAEGTVWHVKQWPGAYADMHCSISTRKPHTEFTPFLKEGQHCVWEPDSTAIVADSGELIDKRENPRSFFEGHSIPTPWDEQHLVYFTGYAMWTYLTTPFLFRLPGFTSEEVEPWDENGETWRRLKVTFPEGVPSHSTQQTFYFDQSGLLRRHDYSVEIMGGTTSANYATDHKAFDGLIFPTKRRVYAAGADNRPILDRIAIAIDIWDVQAA